MKKQPNPMIELTEQELNVFLQSSATFAPDPDVLPRISPLQRSLSLLLWGIALCSIRLHLWNLQYILPAVGSILLVLALIPLRRENCWFRLAWLGAWGNWVTTGLLLFLFGTARYAPIMSGSTGKAMQAFEAAMFFALYLGVLLGTQILRKKSGLAPHYRKVACGLALILAAWIWSALIAPTLPGLLVIMMFIGLFCSLQKTLQYAFDEIEETGYAAHLQPFVLSAHILGVALGAMLLGCTVLGTTTLQDLPMRWNEIDLSAQHQGQEALFDHLISLGMPETLLRDMTPEDVAALDGAKQIVVEQDPLIVTQDMWLIPPSKILPEEPDLVLTTVAVSFSEDIRHLRLIHHFHWVKDVPLGSTAAINVPVSGTAVPTGRVLYEQNSQTFASSYHKITATSLYLLWHDAGEPWTSAVFSFPKDCSGLRGYLMTESNTFSNALGFTTNCHYFFRNTWRVYPTPDVTHALENHLFIADPTKGFYHIPKYVAGDLNP